MRIILFILIVIMAGCSGSTPVAELYNTEASLPAGLPFNPLEWKVISTSINKRDHTMSTLYGNDSAVQCARKNRGYSAACELALVTWQQKEDPHWYGANLPAAVKCVERVSFSASAKSNTPQSSYEKYEGNPLQKAIDNNTLSAARRTRYIVSQQASVMP